MYLYGFEIISKDSFCVASERIKDEKYTLRGCMVPPTKETGCQDTSIYGVCITQFIVKQVGNQNTFFRTPRKFAFVTNMVAMKGKNVKIFSKTKIAVHVQFPCQF